MKEANFLIIVVPTPVDVYKTLLNELELFSADLLEKQRIIFLTKIDAIRDDWVIKDVIEEFRKIGEELIPISSVARKGLDKATYRMMQLVEQHRTMYVSDE